uniref:Rho-GAP domain-containing protein n=1 Tax=Macrostomum lignano TaxID=282301 RepID=A0A1I8F9U2_9PLAT
MASGPRCSVCARRGQRQQRNCATTANSTAPKLPARRAATLPSQSWSSMSPGLELTENEAIPVEDQLYFMANNPEDDPSDENLGAGRITPEGYIDEDFEDTLGSPATEVNTQDLVDTEFKEISRLGFVGDDRLGRKVIIFSACRLPPAENLDHQRLLNTVENDYVLVYFHHGLNSKNKPSFAWLKQAYSEFDRKYKKKSKKAFLIVHPTKLIKALYDDSIQPAPGNRAALTSQYSRSEDFAYGQQLVANPLPTTQFGVSLQHIKHYNGGSVICPVVEHTIKYLRECCLDVEGLFRRSCSVAQVQDVQEKYNRGEYVDFRDLGNPHLAAVLLKTFLRELAEPLPHFELYEAVIENHALPAKTKVADNSTRNKMTALNLGIVFGPSLIWSRQQASLTVMKPINCFTQLLILHYNHIFVR